MRNPPRMLVLLLMSLLALAACGQKGPLFLPGDPSELRSISVEGQAGAAETGDEDEDDDDPRG